MVICFRGEFHMVLPAQTRPFPGMYLIPNMTGSAVDCCFETDVNTHPQKPHFTELNDLELMYNTAKNRVIHEKYT